nr:retrovirus-related Pol polyprotein from transposon TNT 1-94 [Tanacetum cinerariifolium]
MLSFFLTIDNNAIFTAVASLFIWQWQPSSLAVGSSSASRNSITGSGNALCILFPTWICLDLLLTKDETSGILRNFITEIENLKDLKVKIIRVLVNKSQNKTPYELFNSRTHAIGFLRPFRCHVMIINTLDHLGKFDAKGDEGYFVGYSMSSKAFRVFNKRSKRVEEDLHEHRLLTFQFHEAHMESSNSDAQNACNADVSESSGIYNPTATSKIPAAKQMESLTVDFEFLTVSSPVPTVFLDTSPRNNKWIQQYLQNEHYALWEVIEFGDSYQAPPKETGKDSASESSAKKKGRTVSITTEDMQKRRNDVKAITTLLLALPVEHQLRFSKYETAQELWGAILKTFGGNEATKKTKKNQLKQQYDNFKAEGSETLEQTFNRLQAIVSHLEFMDVEIEQDDLN